MLPDDDEETAAETGEGITTTITEEVSQNANQWISLSSSWLRRCYYNAMEQTLYLETDKRSYTLLGVPPDEFIELINAPSPGNYFNDNLKGKY